MTAQEHHVHAAVAKVAPIVGLSFPDGMKNHRTAEIQFLPSATEAQKAAAKQALVSFDPNKKYDPDPAAFLDELARSASFTDAEFSALQRALAITDGAARKSYIARALHLSDTQSKELGKLCQAHCITL